MTPEVLVQSGESQLQKPHFALSNFSRDDGGSGEDVASAKNEEDQAHHRHVPGGVLSERTRPVTRCLF